MSSETSSNLGAESLFGLCNAQLTILGGVVELAGQLQDENEILVAQNQILQDLATKDSKTGVLNARGLQEQFSIMQGQAERGQHDQATEPSDKHNIIVMFDIDNFKQLNSSLGHQGADDKIKSLAETISQNIARRPDDIFGRHGGDEFVAILSSINEQVCHNILEKISQKVKQEVGLTLSVGFAVIDKADDFKQAISKADIAAYRAKALGKDCIVAFSEITEQEVYQRISNILKDRLALLTNEC
jgi:polar amino acid transport system substrate-binding protein